MAWHVVERSNGARLLGTHERREHADAHRDSLIEEDSAYEDVLLVLGSSEDATDREKVIRKSGDVFAFALPRGHVFDILGEPDSDGRALAYVGMPGGGGETCRLLEIVKRRGELEYVLAPTGVNHSVGAQELGYAWPRVQDEHARLRSRWEAAGGDLTRFDAWGRDDSVALKFEELRAELRELEARSSSS